MTIVQTVVVYISTTLVFAVLDLLWLGVVARGTYREALGTLMRDAPHWPAVVIFYLLFGVGVVVFAVLPGVQATSVMRALFVGALFGFFIYMSYELTNLAVIRDWPLHLVFVDVLWVAALTALSATAGYGMWSLINV